MPDKTINLKDLSQEKLLALRFCDLPIKIEGTWLEECVNQLYHELDQKGLILRPPCYLADEWLCPDLEPVVGIAFFLAHPALIKLEKTMVMEVEGGTKPWCMKLLRHETGHAINYAYKLYRRRKWKKIFGPFDAEYEETYRFRPYSKNFVRHLEDYYAQYHPDEDFAETFAVWLTPHSAWRKHYRGWKALEKLQYVDELMSEVGRRTPPVSAGKKFWHVARMRKTLKGYYKAKRKAYAEWLPDFHDANLRRIFIASRETTRKDPQLPYAADILKKYRKEILNTVSRWTGEKKYVINELMGTIVDRCRTLKLLAMGPESLTVMRITSYITTLVMNYLYTGKFRGDE